MPSLCKLRILQRNESSSSLTPKNGVNTSVQNRRSEHLCTKQRHDKQGPKQRYAATTKHHASINHIRKTIYCTQRHRNDSLTNVIKKDILI